MHINLTVADFGKKACRRQPVADFVRSQVATMSCGKNSHGILTNSATRRRNCVG